jgi:hypothetical protein
MKRPNGNETDACCVCGKLLKTPADLDAPGEGELAVWQPNPYDPPQWICKEDWDKFHEEGLV